MFQTQESNIQPWLCSMFIFKHNLKSNSRYSLQIPILVFFSSVRISIFFLLIIITPWPAAPLSFDYSGFKLDDVKKEGDAYINADSEIQLTATERTQNMNYSVGRVTNSKLVHLWDKNSRNLTDFTTNFSFSIVAMNDPCADGMTFFLARPDLPFSKNQTDGGGLGIGLEDDNKLLSSPEYVFVAVEFDTFKNPWDPEGTHVGININDMNSTKTEPWFSYIKKGNPYDYDASINYNSSTHNLSISFSGYSNGTKIQQYLSYQVDLRDYLPEWVTVGFSAATGMMVEVHTLLSWSFSSNLQVEEKAISPMPPAAASPAPPTPENGGKKRKWIGPGIGLSLSLCFIGLAWFLLRKKKASRDEEEFVIDPTMDDEFEKGAGPKKFPYNELVIATNNFVEAEKLGKGGFGDVYRGFLKDLNSYVAIKRISRGSKQGTKEYATEVKVISQLRHKNLVQLIGWCHQKNDLLLIYEFMPNRSLDFHLFEEHNFLTWKVRYNIAQDIASALLYLQESWEQCVLHRDIKSSNIMLDSNFNAKLGDFGLARLVDHNKGSQTTIVAGTMGYMAHECLIIGKASKESDIFSFGVVALEIACGRKAIDPRAQEDQVRIVEWVWELYGTGKLLEAADPKLSGEFDIQQMEHLMVVGLWCAHPDNMLRPSIRQAIHVLNFEVPLPILPKKMPVPTYLPPGSRSLFSTLLSIGATSFEIEDDGSQSSRNNAYTGSSQFSSSSASSASGTILNIH